VLALAVIVGLGLLWLLLIPSPGLISTFRAHVAVVTRGRRELLRHDA
jgi:hypothetical protein